MFELKIVDFVCDSNNRFFKIAKIIKILECSFCCDVSKVRTFINALRVLSNINYKFCYYYLFYLSFFKERKVFYISKKIKKRHEYFEIDFDDCIDI